MAQLSPALLSRALVTVFLGASFAGCSNANNDNAEFTKDLQTAFANTTSETIRTLEDKYRLHQARFIPECKTALGYDSPKSLITNPFDGQKAVSCLKAANVRSLLSKAETIEKALELGFPPAVAVFTGECKRSFAANTAHRDLTIDQATQIYTCALQKAEKLNWERKWYTDSYNWLK